MKRKHFSSVILAFALIVIAIVLVVGLREKKPETTQVEKEIPYEKK